MNEWGQALAGGWLWLCPVVLLIHLMRPSNVWGMWSKEWCADGVRLRVLIHSAWTVAPMCCISTGICATGAAWQSGNMVWDQKVQGERPNHCTRPYCHLSHKELQDCMTLTGHQNKSLCCRCHMTKWQQGMGPPGLGWKTCRRAPASLPSWWLPSVSAWAGAIWTYSSPSSRWALSRSCCCPRPACYNSNNKSIDKHNNNDNK